MESNQTTERKTYHEQKYIDNTLRLREILKTLPAFAKDYFRAAEPTTSAKTNSYKGRTEKGGGEADRED